MVFNATFNNFSVKSCVLISRSEKIMTSGTHRSKKNKNKKEVRLCVRCTESILYAINTLPHTYKQIIEDFIVHRWNIYMFVFY